MDDYERLATRVMAGDLEARDEMIRKHIGLVRKVASRYHSHGLEHKDLIQEGMMGLIKAVEMFDTSFGTRFTTYAYPWIKRTIKEAILEKGREIRIPKRDNRLMWAWEDKVEELSRNGVPPDDAAVASSLELDAKQAERVRAAVAVKRAERLGSASFEFIPAVDNNHFDRETAWQHYLGHFNRLTERERAVMAMRLGTHGSERLTLGEIGARIGVTHQMVSKIVKHATAKLKKMEG